ncbi:MAG: NAD-dependent epimerase/dehydratase family protein [Deltaproteobacteria bacterium]|nr:NAD-dependent epimerase/dehydratase family protein [Deltaproteobacteria bacterium]
MKLLVTGATGFAGSHIARCALARGHEVRVLARTPAKAERLFAGARVEVAAGDMTDRAAVRAALAGCDAVVHAAAAVSLDPRDATRLLRENVAGTACVLGGARELGLAHAVYVSSLTAIWSLPGPDPSAASAVRAGTAGYALAKCEAERAARALQDAGAPLAIVYPSGLIGPDDPGLAFAEPGAPLALSEAVRAFRGFTHTTLATSGGLASVDARDLALFCVRLVETQRAGRFVVGGQFHSWDELVAALEPLLGRAVPRLRAPAWLLRGAGSALDLARRVRPIASLISREAMEYATRMRPLPNDGALAELGVSLRPLAETYRDTLASFEALRVRRRTEGGSQTLRA